MRTIKELLLIVIVLLMPFVVYGELPVKFFVGWSYRHQDDEIHDGVILWAILREDDSYVLTKRKVRLKSFHSPIRDNEGEKSGRELMAQNRESAIIHFTGLNNLRVGPLFLKEMKQPLVNTFNPKVPPSSFDFEFKGRVYTVVVELSQKNDMSIYMKLGARKQLLCTYSDASDALAWLQWVADIDRDNAPDLLISASGHYAYIDHRFFLSSFADTGNLVGEVGRFTEGD